MLNILYCEILKLKRNLLIVIMLLSLVVLNLISCITRIKEKTLIIEWDKFISNGEAILFVFLSAIFFSIIVANIISREYTDKTAAILYTYPVNRIKIFLGKFLAVVFVVILIYTFNFLLILGTGFMINHEPLTKEILLKHIRLNLGSIMFQIALIPFWMLIANLTKNIAICSIIGSMIALSNLVLSELKGYFLKYSPFMLPSSALMGLTKTRFYWDNISILLGIATFLICSISYIIYLSKADIY